jgi:hypothetical protein
MRGGLLGSAVALVLVGCADVPAPGAKLGGSSPAWFGAAAPTGLKTPEIAPAAVRRGTIPKAPLPVGQAAEPEFDGNRIRQSVEQVISFAVKMRAEGNQMWGRISGFPSETRTAEWVADQFRSSGLHDVAVQTYSASGEFWWPNSWEVKVLADPGYGGASKDIVLDSAVPVSRSVITGNKLSAAVVFAGEAGAENADGVAGKIAIQHTRPTTGAYSDRAKVRDSSTVLLKAGAVAVLNWIEQSGNMHVYDFGGCGGPCFNIGGDDGRFLTKAIADAKAKGAPEVKLSLTLDQGMKNGLKASNVIGIIPGASEEIVIVNAHLDSWFDGAGDNADGVGVLVALAKHFSKSQNLPARTLLFVGSGGHHSTGMNGPGNLVTMNGPLLKRAVAVINLEHLAQFQIDAVPTWQANGPEEPKNFGVSNSSPFLVSTVKAAAAKYGFVIQPEITNSVPGDLGGYAPLNVARLQGIHSGPLYHTSGDVLGSISNEGLTKAARFYADLIKSIAKAPAKEINP